MHKLAVVASFLFLVGCPEETKPSPVPPSPPLHIEDASVQAPVSVPDAAVVSSAKSALKKGKAYHNKKVDAGHK